MNHRKLIWIGLMVLAVSSCVSDHRKLFRAAVNGDIDKVENLLAKGAHPDSARNEEGQTALMAAAFARRHDLVRLLLDHGANVNVADTLGRTAVMFAISSGDLEMVKRLVEAGADLVMRDLKGWDPYFLARRGGHRDIMQYVIEQLFRSDTTEQL